jgi:hypothetical protein
MKSTPAIQQKSRRKLRSILTFAAVGIGAWGGALAAPFTFEFDLPAWTASNAPDLFGTSGVLDITVDNGANNASNQTYLNSQITALRLTAVGGSIDESFAGSGFVGDGNASYVSTDAAGVATLDLLASSVTSFYLGFNADYAVQLGIMTPTGGPTPFGINALIKPDPPFAYIAPCADIPGETVGCTGFAVTSTSVPEPATFALVGLGLIALAGGIRSRFAPDG